MEHDQFGGCPTKNSNDHLHKFLTKYDTVKFNEVSIDAIRLRLFPFLLKDKASNWLQNAEPNLFTTWDDLSKAFLSNYFPSSKTANLRADITFFTQ